MAEDSPDVGVIGWQLSTLMAARNHMSQADLVRALQADGAHEISRTQVWRLTTRRPEKLSVDLIGALCRILKCSPNELFGWVDPPAVADLNPTLTEIARQGRERNTAGHVPEAPALPEGAQRLSDEERARIVGPSARGLAAHALARKPE